MKNINNHEMWRAIDVSIDKQGGDVAWWKGSACGVCWAVKGKSSQGFADFKMQISSFFRSALRII